MLLVLNDSAIPERTCTAEKEVVLWGFDVLKIFLAFIVILRHCAQSFIEANSTFYIVVVNILSPVAVPTFFAISGFLLFRKTVTFQRLLHQTKRVLKLYIVWSLIYLPITIYFNLKSMEISKFLLSYLQDFLFAGSYYHLWFLSALAFSFLCVWFLNKHVSQRGSFIILSILFVLGAVAENYSFMFSESLDLVYRMYCRIFLTTRNGLFFGCLFVWIGKYFSENWKNLNTTSLRKCHLIMIPVFLGLIAEGFIISNIQENFVVNMLFFTVPFVFLLMQSVIILSNSTQCKYKTDQLRGASTFAFCFHPIVILAVSFLNNMGVYFSPYIAVVIVVIVCAISTFLFIKIAPKIRILQHLI